MVYLDNAATTMIKPATVGREILRTMSMCASPGRGGHRPAMNAARTVYTCRERAAELFHVADPDRVVFTMNATHGLNIAIRSLAGAGKRVLVSGYEHNSVTRPLKQLGAEIMVAEAPLFDREKTLDAFREKIPEAELVVCTQVSNVFGFVLPVEEIAALCREAGVPLIVDASQSAGILEVDFEKLGADFIAMPGHKGLFGPQGTGILLCAGTGDPLLAGGSGSDSLAQQMPEYLPDRMEAGTHNVPGIAGLMAGMEYVMEKGTDAIAEHEQALLALMIARLQEMPEIELFAGAPGSQSGVLSFRPVQRDVDDLAQYLAERDICLRSGLHCAPFAHRSAGTLETGTLRASFSPFTTESDVIKCCRCIEEFLQRDG
ncbi:MAG: aminotransferase class V-fold PLP-dependent enzyme [Oscillospiraceae bacterium]|nr:aminotransferase class V-fold PLP-dependent enzyme [Oscillospiraceae bacterium]